MVGVVSLSVYGGNFVLAKVCLGSSVSVVYEVEECPLLRGSKCISSIVQSIGCK